jgi:hypothetical protein
MTYDLMKNAEPAHATNKNRFKTNCPFCGKEKHFWFDTSTKMGICFVCMDKHIRLGSEFLLDSGVTTNKSLDELRKALNKVFVSPAVNTSGIDIDKFSEPIDQKRHPMSTRYLIDKRGLTFDDIRKYDIRSGISYTDNDRVVSKWSGRVIFPSYEDKVCVYAIGRTYMNDDRKYVNVDVPKSNIVYGIDGIRNRECIICEGFLSALAAEKVTGVSSVSLLGKTISPLQLYKIRTRADKVWLSLDGGVSEQHVKSVSRSILKAGFAEVWKVSLPDESDPDDLGGEYLKYFDEAIRVRYL